MATTIAEPPSVARVAARQASRVVRGTAAAFLVLFAEGLRAIATAVAPTTPRAPVVRDNVFEGGSVHLHVVPTPDAIADAMLKHPSSRGRG